MDHKVNPIEWITIKSSIFIPNEIGSEILNNISKPIRGIHYTIHMMVYNLPNKLNFDFDAIRESI